MGYSHLPPGSSGLSSSHPHSSVPMSLFPNSEYVRPPLSLPPPPLSGHGPAYKRPRLDEVSHFLDLATGGGDSSSYDRLAFLNTPSAVRPVGPMFADADAAVAYDRYAQQMGVGVGGAGGTLSSSSLLARAALTARPLSPVSEMSCSSSTASAWNRHHPPPRPSTAAALAASYAQAMFPLSAAGFPPLHATGLGGHGIPSSAAASGEGGGGFDWPVHRPPSSSTQQSSHSSSSIQRRSSVANTDATGNSNSQKSTSRPPSTLSVTQLPTPPAAFSEMRSGTSSTNSTSSSLLSSTHGSPSLDADAPSNEHSWLDFLSAGPSGDAAYTSLDLTASPLSITPGLSGLSNNLGANGIKEDPDMLTDSRSKSSFGIGRRRSSPGDL